MDALAAETVAPRRDLFVTGVSGLDEVLDGGLARGGLFLVAGRPGTGKTTLGNQLAYAEAASNAIAIYTTVLAEPHERMLVHLRGFDFFAPDQVARRVHYVSLYDELGEHGLAGALALLRRLVREHRATLLVVDGASLFGDFASTPVDIRRFTSELHAQLAALGCTTVLLADGEGIGTASIGFHVDGVITLEDHSAGMQDIRLLRVAKLRGADPLRGRHHFSISRAGLEVFPRIEAARGRRTTVLSGDGRSDRQPFGIPGLDDMLGGGLPAGSATLLVGVPGTGKTVAGLHFVVEGARRREPGLIACFDESAAQLIAKADALGLDLGAQVAAGLIRVLWRLPLDLPLDAWARDLLAAVGEHAPRRLFVDDAGALQRVELFPERLPAFLVALLAELRGRHVGTLVAAEARTVVGERLVVPPPSFPAPVENAILLRYVEVRSQLRRLVSVIKVRDAGHDTSLREFVIGPRGIEVADTFETAEAVLSDVARPEPSQQDGPR